MDPRPGPPPTDAGMEDGEGSGSKAGPMDGNIEDRFVGLKLCGEEGSDLDLSEEIEELIGEVRWLALFRVHTTKEFSHAALFKQMRNAWAAA